MFKGTNRAGLTINDAGFIRTERVWQGKVAGTCQVQGCCHTAFTVSKDLTKQLGLTAELQALDDWES